MKLREAYVERLVSRTVSVLGHRRGGRGFPWEGGKAAGPSPGEYFNEIEETKQRTHIGNGRGGDLRDLASDIYGSADAELAESGLKFHGKDIPLAHTLLIFQGKKSGEMKPIVGGHLDYKDPLEGYIKPRSS